MKLEYRFNLDVVNSDNKLNNMEDMETGEPTTTALERLRVTEEHLISEYAQLLPCDNQISNGTFAHQ